MLSGFRTKVIISVFIASAIATLAGIVHSHHALMIEGEKGLIEKSIAILSRLEITRGYIAKMNLLEKFEKKALKEFPDGDLSPEMKQEILNVVPIHASLVIGNEDAKKDNNRFRVFALDARNPENNFANEYEKEIWAEFKSHPLKTQIVRKSKSSIYVFRPVYLSQAEGCISCHGHPSTSPWNNGNDIVGYRMENMKDGDLKGVFAIESSLAAVKANAEVEVIDIALWGAFISILAIIFSVLLLREPLNHIGNAVSSIGESSQHVDTASQQISDTIELLSNTANITATSVEKATESLKELSSMVKQTADGALEVQQLSEICSKRAERGETEVQYLSGTMAEITNSSNKIEEIVRVIDKIAFQTNLLALNTAVDAVRSGEHGKQISVVADAVRNLSQRTSAAAKEIRTLLNESFEKIQNGTKSAEKNGQFFNEFLSSLQQIRLLNEEIVLAASKQSETIPMVNQAINQIDQTAKLNATSFIESSISAVEMAQQTRLIGIKVRKLKAMLDGGNTTEEANLFNKFAGRSPPKSGGVNLSGKNDSTQNFDVEPYIGSDGGINKNFKSVAEIIEFPEGEKDKFEDYKKSG